MANWARAAREGAYWAIALTATACSSIFLETLLTSTKDDDPEKIEARMSEASSMAWRASA